MESTKNNARKIWAAVVRHAKEHHQSVNAVVNAYYPQPSSLSPHTVAKTVQSTLSTPRSSYETDN
ncbi:hypothetical protein BFJ63_vAg15695 [Fusarium oxysporum f. sp. narcissi]|uniref:Uncharacterized protein n=1 Tax=Fusarium oxysporum f. sp. narcissi TaxID=451672 RepID=A0A4Q2V9C8_FUSOX|nr:hypothetical protein BFJ63_vAg15695 [Fusarium oxysporum f. sp. narcissi]